VGIPSPADFAAYGMVEHKLQRHFIDQRGSKSSRIDKNLIVNCLAKRARIILTNFVRIGIVADLRAPWKGFYAGRLYLEHGSKFMGALLTLAVFIQAPEGLVLAYITGGLVGLEPPAPRVYQ